MSPQQKAFLRVCLAFLVLGVVVYFLPLILFLARLYWPTPYLAYPAPIETRDLQFAPNESGVKRVELPVEGPSSFNGGRYLKLTVNKTGAEWRLVGPGNQPLPAFSCSNQHETVPGIPVQLCYLELSNKHRAGTYQLEVKNGGSPAPTYAIFSYWRNSNSYWMPYQGKGWSKSSIRVYRPSENSPVAGQKWTSNFEFEGPQPEGELAVETAVEYLPAMPSAGITAPRVERLQNVVRGAKGEVKFVPPAGGALRVTHRATSAKNAEWLAYGASDWIAVRQRAATVLAFRAWLGQGLEVDLDVEVAGTYQFNAVVGVNGSYPISLPWRNFPLQPGRQTVRMALPARKILQYSFGSRVTLRPLVQLEQVNFPVYISFAKKVERAIGWDESNWKLEPDPLNGSATAKPLKLKGKEKAQLVEVKWEMETSGGYCLAYGRLLSKASGNRVEVHGRSTVEVKFSRMMAQLVFPVPTFRDDSDREWVFEGLQICNRNSYPAVVRNWEAKSRFNINLNPKEFAVNDAKVNFEAPELNGFFQYDDVRRRMLPLRFAVPVYAKGPFDRSTRLRVGEIDKGFRVAASQLRPFRSADVPVAEIFVELIPRSSMEDPSKTRLFPIWIEGTGIRQELIVVCPFVVLYRLVQGISAEAR